ncbi:MAG: hypothetical protein U0872_00575 [Planctomycetaceae bacterium]
MPALRPPRSRKRRGWRIVFSRRPFQVTVQVSRQVSRGQVVGQHGVTVMRRKLQSTSRFHYQLTGAPRSTLTFALPKDFLPLDVKATALSDWYLDRRGESPLLVVQLGRTMLGRVEAVITGSRLHDPNAPSAEIVLPQPQEVTRLESTLAIWTDESYRASVQAAEGWRAVDAGTAGPDLQRLRARAADSVRFSVVDGGA